MEAEEMIRDAGLMLIVFNESREILEKDLDLFETVLAQKEVLAGFRHVRSTDIWERIGHRVCTVAVWPTLQR
jgi:N-acetylglutamate synthase-like GNAT family acetyltransferase